MRIGIAGAGFSGAIIARRFAEQGHVVEVFDGRSHVAGNCHTERRDGDGVQVHVYGPHIFHTQWDHVWEFINRFGEFEHYPHRVKATSGGAVYSLPVNLHTINQFFGTTLSPSEAADFVAGKADQSIEDPQTFEEQALRFVGPELYEAFFAGYTAKQWGVSPTELPASILKRLPLRFNYDDTYFNHPYQGMPVDGYTPIVEAILDHASISVELNRLVTPEELAEYDHAFWTGPIDAYFGFEHGRLQYRTLDFEEETLEGDFQGCPVMNYCDRDVPYTRITEHKHFAPWESHDSTVIYREYSRLAGDDDIPYYPIRLVDDKSLLETYVAHASRADDISFLGRLGTYRYLDMDVTIKEALDAADIALAAVGAGDPIPAFFLDPLG